MRMRGAFALMLFALLLWATAATAAIPQTVSYQGILRNTAGTIVPDGDYDLTFKLYAGSVGGVALWTEAQTLPVADGVFNAILGSVSALTLDFSNPYWLGVSVEGAAELTPRLALTATPYSLNADRLDGLSSTSFAASTHTHALDALSDVDAAAPTNGQVLTYSAGDGEWVALTPAAGDDGDWVINGNNIYHLDGKVGVGTPVAKLPLSKPKADDKSGRTPVNPKLSVVAGSGEADAGLYSYFGDTDNAADGRAAIFGYRNSGLANPGLAMNVNATNNAVTGANWYGDPYSFGVAGYSYFDGPRTGGVLGADWNGNFWGALGYQDQNNMDWGVYTPSSTYLGGLLQIPTGAAAGRVLTSDANGWATWQVPPSGVGGSGTANYLPRFTAATTLGNSGLYQSGNNIGLGTTAPEELLHVLAANYPAGKIETSSSTGTATLFLESTGGGTDHLGLYKGGPTTTGTTAGVALANLSRVYTGTLAGPLMLQVTTSNPMHFVTNNIEHMRLTSAGYLGIGTVAPDRPLEVNNASGSALIGQCTHTTGYDYIGVEGYSVPTDFFGIGGVFTGGWKGVVGSVSPTGGSAYYGVSGTVSGGNGSSNYGVYGTASNGGTNIGLYGIASSSASNFGVYGNASGGTTNYAGYFNGNVHVNGILTKSGGAFKIDHPLDPENKTLSHSFVESPDMMNVYNGNIVLGADGSAWVAMPEWFEALNRDFRYQLTCIGGFAPIYVAQEMAGNRFQIAGGRAGLKVSWQVTGIRQDAFANANRIPVEEIKAAKDQGRYLNPEAFGQPETAAVDYEMRHADTKKGEQ